MSPQKIQSKTIDLFDNFKVIFELYTKICYKLLAEKIELT